LLIREMNPDGSITIRGNEIAAALDGRMSVRVVANRIQTLRDIGLLVRTQPGAGAIRPVYGVRDPMSGSAVAGGAGPGELVDVSGGGASEQRPSGVGGSSGSASPRWSAPPGSVTHNIGEDWDQLLDAVRASAELQGAPLFFGDVPATTEQLRQYAGGGLTHELVDTLQIAQRSIGHLISERFTLAGLQRMMPEIFYKPDSEQQSILLAMAQDDHAQRWAQGQESVPDPALQSGQVPAPYLHRWQLSAYREGLAGLIDNPFVSDDTLVGSLQNLARSDTRASITALTDVVIAYIQAERRRPDWQDLLREAWSHRPALLNIVIGDHMPQVVALTLDMNIDLYDDEWGTRVRLPGRNPNTAPTARIRRRDDGQYEALGPKPSVAGP
jgi:hypothetical protein